ncbi:MAG: sigma-E factor negative regulatory protein [Gammaproteobacteria bacterium]|nr:sigma-E factor negative regulatory protein [Gammaproteobacteria bacterium]
MSKSVEQQISELVDGELDVKDIDSVLSALRKDPRLMRQWERAFTMREALRQGLPKRVNHDIAQRVRKAMESEPTYLLPPHARASHPHERFHATHVSPLRRKAVLGLAAAASVFMVVGAVVVKMNVSTLVEVEESSVTASVANQVAPMVPGVTMVSTNTARPALQFTDVHTPQNTQQVWDRQPGLNLDEYMLDHSAYSANNNTVRGFAPYARVVGYPTQGTP